MQIHFSRIEKWIFCISLVHDRVKNTNLSQSSRQCTNTNNNIVTRNIKIFVHVGSVNTYITLSPTTNNTCSATNHIYLHHLHKTEHIMLPTSLCSLIFPLKCKYAKKACSQQHYVITEILCAHTQLHTHTHIPCVTVFLSAQFSNDCRNLVQGCIRVRCGWHSILILSCKRWTW